MQKRFYSNGKLLITSEYLVLDGAIALALPTKFGQDLVVEQTHRRSINWTSYDADGSIWLHTELTLDEIASGETLTLEPAFQRLLSILHQAHLMNPTLLENSSGFRVQTHLSFPRFWGLGSSSTLINNVAQWFGINAYELLHKTFGGSGYDIACAQNDSAILYQRNENKPFVKTIEFKPECAQNIYFVYLNKKQDSRKAIESYRANGSPNNELISTFDQLTQSILTKNDFESLTQTIQSHEQKLSKILQLPTVQERLFADFDGVVKSLGGWGGDFVMALNKANPEAYFKNKGYPTILTYAEMIA
ncbi:MAG: GYDIA family GHMP kinase [Flavobacteriaceae bacterium]